VRRRTLAALGLSALGLACPGGGSGPGGFSAAPRKIEPDDVAVTIRNNCPEAVAVHVGSQEPPPDQEPEMLSSGRVEERRIGRRERLWLRFRGEWSKARTARAAADGFVIEVARSCDAVTSRKGPL
jgi:hypothetical protein